MKFLKRKKKQMETIKLIDHAEVILRFKDVYAQEKLSCEATKNTLWFANDYSCAALVLVSPIKYRIKGTVTRPEYRKLGYGTAMLQHLTKAAKEIAGGKSAILESFAKNPKWYLDNGFAVQRVTKWGTSVVQKTLQ